MERSELEIVKDKIAEVEAKQPAYLSEQPPY
jgi:hypothetical protein